MAVQNYAGAQELPLTEQEQMRVELGTATLRDTMQLRGFAKEAADAVRFEVRKYTLTISNAERQSGAFHMQADGQPFYTVTVSAPGTIMDMQGIDGKNPTAMPAVKQALLLAFEIGMNLFDKVEKVIELNYGSPADPRAGGVSGDMLGARYETTTRRDPLTFFAALDDLVNMRIDMLMPKTANDAKNDAKPAAPKRAAGPTP